MDMEMITKLSKGVFNTVFLGENETLLDFCEGLSKSSAL